MENIDKFYTDFNFVQTPEEKKQMLDDFAKNNVISDDDYKELLAQINDLIEGNAILEDMSINLEIEDGVYQLYTCLKSLAVVGQTFYNSGNNYYVKVDDPKEFYLSTGIGETNAVIQNMINSIKPTYFIVVDDGIGTLKRKNIFPKDVDFSNYFTKFA
jgi:hypothetical protein